jgi:hypothetical protein
MKEEMMVSLGKEGRPARCVAAGWKLKVGRKKGYGDVKNHSPEMASNVVEFTPYLASAKH